MATVKNVTAHYRQLCNRLLEARAGGPQPPKAASSGRCRYTFTPDPERAYNRGGTDYFVHGRREDIGAFDTPKHAGVAIGHVVKVAPQHVDVELNAPGLQLNNGDALTWVDLQGALQGVPVNVARHVAGRLWRVEPNIAPGQTTAVLKGLRKGAVISRNRDMAWERLLEKKSAERTIAADLRFEATAGGFALALVDADGHRARATVAHAHEPPKDAARAEAALREQLSRLGGTLFEARSVELAWRGAEGPLFVPASVANALRREAVAALEAARAAAFERLPRAAPVEPPVPYPEDTLSYLANVFNAQAAAFYARHGVRLVEAAYESHEELGEVSLMITRHCVRYSLSLCPKQAKGVQGVQGTIRAEPLHIRHGDDVLTLRFDCKPCEMHVVGSMRRNVLQQARREQKASLATPQPIRFYGTRPAVEPAR